MPVFTGHAVADDRRSTDWFQRPPCPFRPFVSLRVSFHGLEDFKDGSSILIAYNFDHFKSYMGFPGDLGDPFSKSNSVPPAGSIQEKDEVPVLDGLQMGKQLVVPGQSVDIDLHDPKRRKCGSKMRIHNGAETLFRSF